jgi:hypothetical protein
MHPHRELPVLRLRWQAKRVVEKSGRLGLLPPLPVRVEDLHD